MSNCHCATCMNGSTGILEYSAYDPSGLVTGAQPAADIGHHATVGQITPNISWQTSTIIPIGPGVSGENWTQKIRLIAGPGNFNQTPFTYLAANATYTTTIINYIPDKCLHCCPLPATCQPPIPSASCQLQYENPSLVICYKPTLYNTNFYPGSQSQARGFLNYTGGLFKVNGVGMLFPRNQNGRFNHTKSNTKLFPIISQCRGPEGELLAQKQASNLFINTDYNMPKKELMSYLARNRNLNR